MSEFRRAEHGVTARFTAAEAAVLRTLVSQIAELVGRDAPGGDLPADPASPAGTRSPGSPEDLAEMLGRLSGPAGPPEDPVLARLFPDAYRGDPDAAGEFRRYTEDGLRAAKIDTARQVLETLPDEGGRVRLTGEQAQAWLRALNDVRLALGVRLEITEDFPEQFAALPSGDPRAGYFQIYDWLTYVQESLVQALQG